MRKVYVRVTHKLIINMGDDATLDSVMGEMDCEFNVCKEIDNAEVIDSEMEDWEILDSK